MENVLIKLHKRCIIYMTLVSKRQDNIYNIKRLISIEDRKPFVRSYLFASKNDYLLDIEQNQKDIDRLYKWYYEVKERINQLNKQIWTKN